MIEGSSVDPRVAAEVRAAANGAARVMVVLDSNHTLDHVERELALYAPLVTEDCYLVVFDTLLEDMPADLQGGRPWGPATGRRRRSIASWSRTRSSRSTATSSTSC